MPKLLFRIGTKLALSARIGVRLADVMVVDRQVGSPVQPAPGTSAA